MLDLVVLNYEPTATGVEMWVKPLHPCKIGKKLEKLYAYNPYPGVEVVGEPALELRTVLPHRIAVKASEIPKAYGYTLAPFYFVCRHSGKRIDSLGELMEAERQACVNKLEKHSTLSESSSSSD